MEREIAEWIHYEGSIRRSNALSYVRLVHESVIVTNGAPFRIAILMLRSSLSTATEMRQYDTT